MLQLRKVGEYEENIMSIYNQLYDEECGDCSHYNSITNSSDDKNNTVFIGECQCKSSDHNRHILGYSHPACRYFKP